jgi:hypothetical protein
MASNITCQACDDVIQPSVRHIEMCAVDGPRRVGVIRFCSMECLVTWATADGPVRCGTCEGCLAEGETPDRSLS